MIHQNYLSRIGFTFAAASILFTLPSCGNNEKPTVQPPVRVSVEVMGGATQGAAQQGFSGTVESADESTVSFSVPGTITRIYVDEGQMVTKGQVLASVNSNDLTNTSNMAQASLDEARDAYNRMKKLHDANALPEIKWVEAQSKLKQAENAAALARRGVSDATIHAPISGYVTEKIADDGQNVLPSQPVLKIVNLNDIRVSISVPEEEISYFVPGCRATIVFAALDGLTLDGKMTHKSVVADPLTRSYDVKFDIPNVDGKILPGMIASVDVEGLQTAAATPGTTFVLPSQAVQLEADNSLFVWVVKNGKAYRKVVTADELSDKGAVVKSGLCAGDTVIVAGMQKVCTGSDVEIVK